MIQISAKEARAHWSEILDRVEQGEEVLILRHGKKMARLLADSDPAPSPPSLKDFRKSIKRKGKPFSQSVIEMRKNERA